MLRPNRLRLLHLSLVPLCVAAGLLAPTSAGAITPAQCDAQVNDTPGKLLPCIQTPDLSGILQNFQGIAIANPSPADGMPSRNSGEPGYEASVDYVAQAMQAAGYTVTIQPYKFFYYNYTGIPTFTQASPVSHSYVVGTDWFPGQSLGTATGATLQPAGGIIIPPTSTPSSTSGCTSADFSGFVPGRIALIQRGGCFFGVKVLNAQAAGASGVIIFNEGNPGRTGLLAGSLVNAAGARIVPTIPVAFTTFAIGADLYNQYQQAVAGGTALPVMSLHIGALVNPNADDWNVIAESKGGAPNHVVVVDAHLDAIYGAGMLDNATGSAAILDIAEKMKNVNPLNKLRFIWFGGEELGLLGSQFYVNSLTVNELNHIGYDLDADVLGTPNYTLGVLDPASPNLFGGSPPAFPNRIYAPSTVARDQAIAYLTSLDFNHELFSPVGTDALNFNAAGIPASGVLTGQDCCKTQREVDLFGGFLGNFDGNIPSFDGGCVDNPFRWCDNISNVNLDNMTLMSRTFANSVVRMAFDTKVMSSSNNAVFKPKLPIASEVSRSFSIQ
jgi:hypothetical protein